MFGEARFPCFLSERYTLSNHVASLLTCSKWPLLNGPTWPILSAYLTCPDLICPNLTYPNLTCPNLTCLILTCPELTFPVLNCHIHILNISQTPHRLPPDTVKTPTRHLPGTLQTISRHIGPFLLIEIRWGLLFHTPSKHPPSSLQTSSWDPPDAFQPPSWHLPDNFQKPDTILIPIVHPPETYQTCRPFPSGKR